jgi:hypothetical protein
MPRASLKPSAPELSSRQDAHFCTHSIYYNLCVNSSQTHDNESMRIYTIPTTRKSTFHARTIAERMKAHCVLHSCLSQIFYKNFHNIICRARE